MIPIKKLFSPRRPAHAYACIRARPPERSQGQYGAMLAPLHLKVTGFSLRLGSENPQLVHLRVIRSHRSKDALIVSTQRGFRIY